MTRWLIALGRRLVADDKLRARLLKALRGAMMLGGAKIAPALEAVGIPGGMIALAIGWAVEGAGFLLEQADVSSVDTQVQDAYGRGYAQGVRDAQDSTKGKTAP